jgi:hypothetical protein
MANLLRYARETSKALVQNPKHKHAASHALVAYRTGAVFTFIPKNGCTTLRYSLALANGAIRGPEDFVWIHANNGTFSASLAELVRADVSVVILRCPFQRLASAFLDKFVSYERNAWDFRRNMDDAVDLPDLTFREFVTGLLERPVLLRSDNHWRPQIDFLVYEDYTHWIGLSELSDSIDGIAAETGVKLEDTRNMMRHHLGRKAALDGSYVDAPLRDLHALMLEGKAPSHGGMYDDALRDVVTKIYKDDLGLVRDKCSAEPLLFP